MIRPATRDLARKYVAEHHSHHDPHGQQVFAIADEHESGIAGVVVVEYPKAKALNNGRTLEVTRLCVGPNAPHCTASKLLGAAWRTMAGMGVRRGISYTRVDEDGTCYRAAGWVSTKLVRGEKWDHGAYALRWLPGLYEPSTEIVDRVRWEIGPDAATTRVKRTDSKWVKAA